MPATIDMDAYLAMGAARTEFDTWLRDQGLIDQSIIRMVLDDESPTATIHCLDGKTRRVTLTQPWPPSTWPHAHL